MRSIAPFYHKHPGIRVNAICPAPVRTNLLDQAAWNAISDDVFVPIECVVDAVLKLVDGVQYPSMSSDGVSDGGTSGVINGERPYGNAVVLSGQTSYIVDQQDYVDEHLRRCMLATERETYAE